MEFRLLGPLEVLDGDGRPRSVRGSKPRALLALLLLREGRVATDERLIDELWGDDPPPTARAALQMHVSALRKALGPEVVVRRDGGYALPLGGHALDVQRFETLVETARSAQPARAAAAAREALDLWRGEPEADAPRLSGLRRDALEARLRAELELGRAGELVPELRELVASDPLHEPLRALLALALYRAGRQAEALDELARARETLVEELGLEPGPELQRLQRAILVQDPALAPAAATVPRLPAAATPLVGRDGELAEIAALLDGGARLLTLTGPGGIGKTSLALEALRRLDAPVALVELAEIDDPALVPDAIAAALGLDLQGESPLERVATWLAATGAVLLLDNFEQVVDAAPAVAALLAAAATARVVVTSRTLLRLPGEQEFAVPALRDAVELFRARATGPLDDHDSIRAICDRLEHIPLAVELAAARTRLLSPRALLERLDSPLGLLAAPVRGLPERQRTMRAAIDWSVRLLDLPERTLFARFAVFAGGATVDSVEEVCGAGLDVLAVLEQLVDRSLVQRRDTGAEPRFAMLETIRQYAAEQLAAGDEEEAVRDRHLAWLVRLTAEASDALQGPEQELWLHRLAADLPNLRAALTRALDRADAGAALTLAGGARRFWQLHARSEEGRRWLERALELPGGDPAARLRACLGLGMLCGEQGDYDGAGAAYEAARTLARELGDTAAELSAGINLASVVFHQGDEERAEELSYAVLAECRAAGAPRQIAGALENLGGFLLARGELVEAARCYAEAVDLTRELGELRAASAVEAWLARTLVDLGDLARARPLLQSSLETTLRLGHRQGVATVVAFTGAYALAGGDAASAARLQGASDALWTEAAARPTRDYVTLRAALVAALRRALPSEAYAAETAAGALLDAHEAAALAREALAHDVRTRAAGASRASAAGL